MGEGGGAASYEYCYDTTNDDACDPGWVSTGAATSAGRPAWANNTTYYWQVRANNGSGTTYADGGSLVVVHHRCGSRRRLARRRRRMGLPGWPLSPTLSWGACGGGHLLRVLLRHHQRRCLRRRLGEHRAATTSAALAGLAVNTTYYWQVRANNGFGTTYADGGTWWAFTTGGPPGGVRQDGPGNGATGQPLSPTLSWGASAGATSYEYCYDTTNDDACDGVWVSTGTATSARPRRPGPEHHLLLAGAGQQRLRHHLRRRRHLVVVHHGGPVLLEASFRSVGAYDGWVLEQDEASGKGGTFDATATTGRVGDDASDRQYRSILHFDTSSLPDDAVITGVTLRIKRQSIIGHQPVRPPTGS